jgi:hypothetical protein
MNLDSESEQHRQALIAAKRLIEKRIRYDHVVYPVERFRMQRTVENRKLQHAILHLDNQLRAIWRCCGEGKADVNGEA